MEEAAEGIWLVIGKRLAFDKAPPLIKPYCGLERFAAACFIFLLLTYQPVGMFEP